jgi:hypothetical protein
MIIMGGASFIVGALAFLAVFGYLAVLEESRFSRWLGWSGVGFSAGTVQVVADLNNVLLPLWMIVMGASLIRSSRQRARG